MILLPQISIFIVVFVRYFVNYGITLLHNIFNIFIVVYYVSVNMLKLRAVINSKEKLE